MHQHHSHQKRYDDHLSTSADNIHQQQQQQHHMKQKQQQSALSSHRHQHYHQQQQSQQSQQSHQHQHRKNSQSHSPHHSRHTSPHSHHSHSLHSSPHQSHQHVNASSYGTVEASHSPTRTIPTSHRASIQSSSSHSHHHHHHRRRSRRQHNHHTSGSGGGSGNSSVHGTHGHSHHSQERTSSKSHGLNCTRRHRSTTDISSASLNTSHDPVACADREVQEIFVHKACCSSSSRAELAQFFAEDLYGSSRRPSSCCTSSDYCYQTDSTSLYGSRSSLSRNNSVKSASVAMRKRRALHQRQPSYTSISLRGFNTSQSHPSSRQQVGSLSSVFDRNRSRLTNTEPIKSASSAKVIVSPSKVTIERQTSKDALSQDLPDYACSPSPIRWSFLADEKSQSEIEIWKSDEPQSQTTQTQDTTQQQQKHCRQTKHHRTEHASRKSLQDEGTSRTSTSSRKFRESPFSCDPEETSTTVLFHQEGEAYNNCCNNYIQCNTYLDQDLQITSEDIQQYLSKGSQNGGDILNNSKSYPFQPTNALEFQYKNNFASNSTVMATGIAGAAGTAAAKGTGTAITTTTATTTESSEVESVLEGNTYDFRHGNINRRPQQNSSKDTNLNQDWSVDTVGACAMLPSRSSTPLSAANINLSSSSNNINIIFNTSSMGTTGAERRHNANEVKFINTTRRNVSVSTEAHHAGYLPYTQPAYDYTNMSSNSLFDKPLGIDELPKEFESSARKLSVDCSNHDAGHVGGSSSSDGQHSSPLPSPVQKGVSFESFDAPSDHNLISQRGSCQFSSPTPRSPLSPACSSISASVNPAATAYIYDQAHQQPQQQQQQQRHHHHHHHHHQHQHQHHHRSPVSTMHHSHCYDCHQQHASESFKLSNAFKKVRKRARKYTEFLRKK